MIKIWQEIIQEINTLTSNDVTLKIIDDDTDSFSPYAIDNCRKIQ